jgi:hypothetical protein
MSDNVEHLILEQFRALRNQIEGMQTEMRSDFKDVKQRLHAVELALTGSRRDALSVQEDVYRQQVALDLMNERIQRIEKRLEISL